MSETDFSIEAHIEQWPLKVPFVIARSSRTHVETVLVEVRQAGFTGRGECQPNPRYNHSGETVVEALDSLEQHLSCLPTPEELQRLMPAGPARNALDCALLDLAAKKSHTRVWQQLALPEPAAVETVYTISMGNPSEVLQAAQAAWDEGYSLLKLKLGGAADMACAQAVRSRLSDARLVADANEGWALEDVASKLRQLADLGFEMVEQPLPAGQDALLAEIERPLTVCADESAVAGVPVAGLADRYDMINIKLDKTGGLSAALAMAAEAQLAGMQVMTGCMLGTSLAMAPAHLLAGRCSFADLDGALLLRQDREHAMISSGALLGAPSPSLWG